MAVDVTELEYIRTFLGFAHSSATAKSRSEVGKITAIDDTEKILVYPGELLKVSMDKTYTKRYLVKLSEVDEAGMMGMFNGIVDACDKLNKRLAIGAYSKPSVLVSGNIAHGNKPFENYKTKRWEQDIYMDFVWATS